MGLTRVFPNGAMLAAEEAFDGWDPAAAARDDRPAVSLNMVVSVDGRAALDGASAGLSVPADREIFHALRGRVDAVLAGTGTLRAEGYGRLVKDAGRRAAREARGLTGDPLAVVVSRSGDVPDVPLLADPQQPSVVLTGENAAPAAALARLRTEHGVRSLLCEGGPTLNRVLLDAGAVDDLFVTLSPLLAGGEPPFPLLAGTAMDPPVRLELAWALEAQSALFLRYRVVRGSPA